MSETLNLRKEVCAAIEAAGLDPSLVFEVQISPDTFYASAKVPTEGVREEVKALCEAAGYDANSVASLKICPDSVQFELYMEPKQVGADGPLTVFVTHPYGGKR